MCSLWGRVRGSGAKFIKCPTIQKNTSFVGFLSLLHSGHIGPKRTQSLREGVIIFLLIVHPTLYFCISTFSASDQSELVVGNREGKANNTSDGETRMISILEYIRKILHN